MKAFYQKTPKSMLSSGNDNGILTAAEILPCQIKDYAEGLTASPKPPPLVLNLFTS